MIELRIICKSRGHEEYKYISYFWYNITFENIFFCSFFPIFPLTKDRMIPEIGYHASKNLMPFPWDFPTLFEFRWMSFVKNVKKELRTPFLKSLVDIMAPQRM